MKKKNLVDSVRWNKTRSDDGNAFLPDPYGTHHPLPEQDAEAEAEELIDSATMGESVSEDARDEVVDEEEKVARS